LTNHDERSLIYRGERADGLPGLLRLARVSGGPGPGLSPGLARRTDRNAAVKVQIDPVLCQGHGRCYDLAPGLFGDDDEGYGQVLGDGLVPPGQDHEAHLAVANCPERAITLAEGA
jgi:ferredoxin